jgi:hypothetical protein
MRDIMTDGMLQVSAGVSLLENSRLVEWISGAAQFVPVGRDAFEFSWRKDIDPVFGRLICWISFSAGAEFLAKGVCLVRGIEIRKEQEVPLYPTVDINTWASKFRKDWRFGGTTSTTYFGSLGGLTHDDYKAKITAALTQLCSVTKATAKEQDLLFAAYELLRKSIRNRDAHAYVPNVRDSHYNLVPDLFAACFNILVSWLPGGATALNQWREDAKSFVAAL